MACFVPIKAPVHRIAREAVTRSLADFEFLPHASASLRKAREEHVLELASGANVYFVDYYHSELHGSMTYCFFAHREQDVLDLYDVAEVMDG